jgi:hypothetical protein
VVNDGIGIYVVDAAGRLYMSKEIRGVVHHSTFFAGQPVAFAGLIRISSGRLKYIDLESGHYAPGPEMHAQLIAYLKDMGIDTSEAKIEHRQDPVPPAPVVP